MKLLYRLTNQLPHVAFLKNLCDCCGKINYSTHNGYTKCRR